MEKGTFYCASSAGRKTRNADGSRNVHCKRCGALVGTASALTNFGSVTTCALCDAADQGIALSSEVIDSLTSVRVPGLGLVPRFVVTSEDTLRAKAKAADPLNSDPEAVLSPRYWIKAVTLKVKKSVRELLQSKELPSQKLAREKRRKPIFERTIEEEINKE